MFKRYQKEAISRHQRYYKGIEHKRQKVIAGIDAWLAKNRGESVTRVQRLSRIEGEIRLVWLKYSRKNVPLNTAGDLIGEISAQQDEAAFWDWMKRQILAGVYDTGIEQIAATVHRRLQGGKDNLKG